MEVKFYRCRVCGQIVTAVKGTKAPLVCCGEQMEELLPDSVDAVHEKHVPVAEVKGDKVVVRVGSVMHPMIKEHLIEWIALETKHGLQIRKLKPDMEPVACFRVCDGIEVTAVYAYCNLHGLWKA